MICETVLLNKLKKQFGHKDYRNDLQKKATEAIYKGNRDIYICMPSGFGKSLCFQLPVIAKNNSFAIIISPTIAYSKSQTDYLRSKKIPAYSWDAHTPRNIRVQIKNDITSCQPKLKFLYITAEQCTTSHFLFILSEINPKISFYFVIDEAHRISPFSHDFKHSYHELIELREKCPDAPFITLTATATKKIKEDIVETLKMNNPLVFSMPVSRSNISYDIWFTDILPDPLTHLKEFIETSLGPNNALLSDEIRNCGIIFCENHETTISLAKALTSMGIQTLSYHTRMKIKNRFNVQQLWYSGAVPVITVTNSFSIGISKQSVRFVVHWNVHLNIGKYYQQSGRAGHDCKLSYSRAYYQFEEPSKLVRISEETELPLCSCMNEEIYRQNQIDTLVQMKENVTKIECRHVMFSKYFDDRRTISCVTLCDVCKDENFAKEKLSQFKLFKQNTFQSVDLDRILNDFLQQNFTLDEYGNTRNFSQSTILDSQQDSQNINDTIMEDSTIIENEISNNSQCRRGINDLLISNKSIPSLYHSNMSAEELIQKIQSILYVKTAQKASFPSDSTAQCKTRMNDELINNNQSKPSLENSEISAEELIQKMQNILYVKKALTISSSPIFVEKEVIPSTQSICKPTSTNLSKDTEVDHIGELPMTALNTDSTQFETACEDWNSVLGMNSTNIENIQSSNFSSFYETAIENPECGNFVVNSNSTSFNINTLHRESTECCVHKKNNMSVEEQLEKIYRILYVKKTKIPFVSTEDSKKVNEHTKKRLRSQDLQESESSGNVNEGLKRQKI